MAPAAEPQANPLLAWPAGPLEVRVTFERPLDPAVVKSVIGRTIPYYETMTILAAGSRRPAGPAIGALRIAGSQLADDGRTLVLATDPHPRQAYYDLSAALDQKSPQAPLIYTLSGVEATWDNGGKDAAPERSGWLPGVHIDPEFGFRGTSVNANWKALMARPGRLTIKGSFVLPKGKNTLIFNGSGPFTATVNGEEAKPATAVGRQKPAEITVDSDGIPCDLVAVLTTGLELSFSITSRREEAESKTLRALTEPDVLLPWVPAPIPIITEAPPAPFDLSGGDRKKGEAVFLSEAAKCSACHSVGGKGGNIGPGLDALKGRDLAEVYFHIAEPSAKIVPDYLTYTVARKNGQIAVGVVKAEGFDAIKVTDIGAQSVIIPKAEIEELRPSATSIMPVGLPGALGETNMRDLLAFLTQKE